MTITKRSIDIIAGMFIFLSMMSCAQPDMDREGDTSIIGIWQQTERAYSIGAGIIVEDITGGEVYEIRDDSTFTYNAGGRESGTWDISIDNVLNFNFEVEVENRVVNFTFEQDGDILIFRPAFVICTEGCYYKYERR